MTKIFHSLRAFAADEAGATAIEYGLIAALIVVVILGSVQAVADGTIAMYQLLASAMNP
jgi:pilus assembly protein Flp/PilA